MSSTDASPLLSTSPTSISFLAYDTAYEEEQRASSHQKSTTDHNGAIIDDGPITLREFVDALPSVVRSQKERGSESADERATQQDELRRGSRREDPISALFGRLDLSRGEWRRYALFEPGKSYTRNLIATDDESFTLLVLCWNAKRESPIHDHPCGKYKERVGENIY